MQAILLYFSVKISTQHLPVGIFLRSTCTRGKFKSVRLTSIRMLNSEINIFQYLDLDSSIIQENPAIIEWNRKELNKHVGEIFKVDYTARDTSIED